MAFLDYFNTSIEELAGNQIKMAGGQATLTDAVATTVVTGLTKVIFAAAVPSTDTDSFFHAISAIVNGGDAGSIDLAVKGTADPVTGTRVVNWIAFGY